MEPPKLNDDEWKLYSELYAHCDVDGTGKLRFNRVNALLQTSLLSTETVLQVRTLLFHSASGGLVLVVG